MPSSENSICILGQSMVYSLLLMAVPSADCAVVAQLDRALDSDSKGQRFESPRPHQKAAVLDGGLFLLLSRGPGSKKAPLRRRKGSPERGFRVLLGALEGLQGVLVPGRGPSTLQEAQQRPDERPPKQRGGQLAPASAGYLSFAGQKLPRCDQKQWGHTFPFAAEWHRCSSLQAFSGSLRAAYTIHLRRAGFQ